MDVTEHIEPIIHDRRRRWPWVVLPLLLLLFAANHLEHYFRSQRLARNATDGLTVRAETNLLTGHTSIGIAEQKSGKSASGLLHFAVLGQWNYTSKTPGTCPSAIMALNGKIVSCIGFMYPLEAGKEIKTFCLMRTTQTCCYGPRPQYNQYLLTEMKSPVKFERLAPVVVSGKFVVDPQPSQGFIYRLEGETVTPIADDGPEENPAEVSKRTKLPLFDFSLLSGMENQSQRRLSPELLKWDGQTVLAAGYFADREGTQFLICRNYWNGANPALAPSFFNSLMAIPEDRNQIPPLWCEKGIMQGVAAIEKDPSKWSEHGIVRLLHAVSLKKNGPQLRADVGPFAAWWEELLVFAAVLYWSFRRPSRNHLSSEEQS